MKDTTDRAGDKQSSRWSGRLGWMRTVLQAIQTAAILARVWHDLQ